MTQPYPQPMPAQPMPGQPMPGQPMPGPPLAQPVPGQPMAAGMGGPPMMMSPVEQQMDMMRRQQLAESQAQTQYKSAGAAYLLWFFLGIVGGHRWYLRSPGVAIGQLLTLGGLGFWAFFDVFAIGGRLARVNGDIRREVYHAHGIPVA